MTLRNVDLGQASTLFSSIICKTLSRTAMLARGLPRSPAPMTLELSNGDARMSDYGHLAQLREGGLAWNEWRRLNEGVRINLRNADLYGADLSGIDLSRAA